MTRAKKLGVVISVSLIILGSAAGLFWYWHQSRPIIINPNLPNERLAELEKELTDARQKLAAEPKNIDHHIVVGRLERMLGRLSSAERSYKEALKIDARDYVVYIDLGVLYKQMGRIKEAENKLRLATELNPSQARGFEELIDLYFQYFPGQSEELKNIFRAASDYTSSPDIWARYARFLEDRLEYREALIYYQEALTKQPEDGNLKEAVARVSKTLEAKGK